jgi:hypothetical protein
VAWAGWKVRVLNLGEARRWQTGGPPGCATKHASHRAIERRCGGPVRLTSGGESGLVPVPLATEH